VEIARSFKIKWKLPGAITDEEDEEEVKELETTTKDKVS
jgi:hypothetical protein